MRNSKDFTQITTQRENTTNQQNEEGFQTFLSQREKDLKLLASFRLMDNFFFSEALDGKREAVELIIQTILGRNDIVVRSTKAQVVYTSAASRSVQLDIVAQDAQKKVFDVEIQRKDEGTGARRARFHSSMMDRNLLKKGDKFESLVDTYVIFITENDIFDAGLPIYHIERKITELNNELFEDGAHIIYVNGEFQDLEHPIGRLMHDFLCEDPKEMLYQVLAKEVRYLKETEGGQSFMNRAFEEMRKEVAKDAAKKTKNEIVSKMLKQGMTFETISTCTEVSIDDIQILADGMTA
jgi:hypothetical protein